MNRRARQTKRPRGFTLVEVMIAIMVLAVLSAVAVPSYSNYIRNQRVKTASHQLFASLMMARSEAIKRNTNVRVLPDGNWENGWVVTSNGTRTYAECDVSSPPADCLRFRDPLKHTNMTGGPGTVTYTPAGRLAGGGNVSFNICDDQAGKHIDQRVIRIDLTGRPNITTSGDCS